MCRMMQCGASFVLGEVIHLIGDPRKSRLNGMLVVIDWHPACGSLLIAISIFKRKALFRLRIKYRNHSCVSEITCYSLYIVVSEPLYQRFPKTVLLMNEWNWSEWISFPWIFFGIGKTWFRTKQKCYKITNRTMPCLKWYRMSKNVKH